MGRVGTADWASLHTVWLLDSQNAPFIDAVPTYTFNITHVRGRPAGAALNPEPRTCLNHPFWVGLPPAVKHPIRGYIHSFRGAETQRFSLNLLLTLLFEITEVYHLQQQREKLVNRPINTTQMESRTQDVGDKWVFRAFKVL